eukprot:CAMPEP_0117669444 /NCGR_PEP_ID=MMETSP0804-20121206/12138_1 /TAXON_ID=1074897 /ORGANISM="Tetraselmis astigmatica, Strain CCMP880" /LENGTH=169 /DNA_ID=CAMNT_0005477507 /DNA_START=288 /DNA_END=795 /DNA_ORIENTATION=+
MLPNHAAQTASAFIKTGLHCTAKSSRMPWLGAGSGLIDQVICWLCSWRFVPQSAAPRATFAQSARRPGQHGRCPPLSAALGPSKGVVHDVRGLQAVSQRQQDQHEDAYAGEDVGGFEAPGRALRMDAEPVGELAGGRPWGGRRDGQRLSRLRQTLQPRQAVRRRGRHAW